MRSRAEAIGGLDWAVSTRPLDGGPVSGDLAEVVPAPGGALVAVMDGLGHGPEAHAAARCAASALRIAPGEPLPQIIARCHLAARRTRGVAISLARVDARRGVLAWAGVGNVEGWVLHADGARERILLAGGIVGYTLPAHLPVREVGFGPGDLLVLATDGVEGDATAGLDSTAPLDALTRVVLDRNATGRDDALALVARCERSRP